MLGKHTLKPGETGTTTVIYDTQGLPGPFEKKLMIATDIQSQGDFVVLIRGTVKAAPSAKIQVIPRKLDLAVISPGETRKQVYRVTNTGTLPLVVEKIYAKKGDCLCFDAEPKGRLTIEPGDTQQLSLTFRPAMDRPGRFVEVYYIQCNARNARNQGYPIMVLGAIGDGH